VIVLHDVSYEIEQLSLAIKNKTKHSYLEKFIKSPVINKDKLTILSFLLKQSTLPEDKQYHYIVATTLVQMALDTHDHVQITNKLEQDETDVTTRQLTVLAGDYYSALYYFLLSEIDDIHIIRVLASAIKEVNEYKMQLYDMVGHSFSHYMTLLHKIDTTLLTHVAADIDQSFLSNVTNQILQTHHLISQQQTIQSGKQSLIINDWLEYAISDTKQSVLNAVEAMIEERVTDIQHIFSDPSFDSSILDAHLSWLIKPICRKTSVAREG